MIQGYPDDASAFPGDTITFHVATDAPQFRIEFFRQGPTLQDTGVKTDWLVGNPGDDHEADQDFGAPAIRGDGLAVDGWQGYPFQIPDWQTGVYIAMFVEGDGNGQPDPNQNPPLDRSTPDARTGKALFVVKNPNPGIASPVLYKIPLFTYQMYNMTRYTGIDGQVHAGAGYGFTNSDTGQGTKDLWVTFHRPGGGTGGTPWDAVYFERGNLDPLDLVSFRQTFVHWDTKMISWLEGNGFRIDYCTDLDVHLDADASLLSPYALVLSVGHDEYYSSQMRDHLETYVANGGNIAFFSGNTCYWRLIFPVQGSLLNITRDGQWFPGRPEDSLTGVGFRHGGERNYPVPENDSQKVGYTVQYTDYWPFENTGLNDGQPFAKAESIVGYECDGTPYDRHAPLPVRPSFNPEDHTPPGFVILGTGVTDVWPKTMGAAVMGMYTAVGTVFTASTTDWPRVVSGEARTAQITTNVMNRLGGNPKGLASLATLTGAIACDGFFSADDNYRHAIVGTDDGGITEVFFNQDIGIGQTRLVTQANLLDLGSFYTDDDHYRHVITATADGNISETFYNPNTGIGQALLGNIPGAFRVAGFSSDDDNFRHAIVATRAGEVFEIFFNPHSGQGQDLLGTFNSIVDISAFYSPDDQVRHVIVGTADGSVTEIYFNPRFGINQVVIGNVPRLVRVSSYYAAADFFNRRAQVLTDQGRIHEIRYHRDFGIMRAVLFNTTGLTDLGAFHSPDDNYRHAILATPAGAIQELFFTP